MASSRQRDLTPSARRVRFKTLLVLSLAYGCASEVSQTRAESTVVDLTIGLTILSSPLLALERREVYRCSLREIGAWV